MRRLLAILLALFPLTATAAARFEVRPAPAWVEKLAVDTTVAVPKSDARWGMYSILDDHQVRSDGATTVDYTRRVRKIVSPNGVQNASELDLDFDPSYQKLVIHEVTLLRGEQRIRELEPSQIRVIEKEDESGSGIYDGMLTAVAFLDDVRPGDVLDYSWSVEGANPLLGGRYADTFDITSPVPARLIRHRLLFPASRHLQFRTLSAVATRSANEPQVATHGDEREYTWQRRDVAPLDVEDSTPAWFDPYDHIQVSEFASWNEIARWAADLFRMTEASRAETAKVAAKIRAEHPTREAQIVAAIRFVQDDIRYLGIEMGRNSHEPHQPAETLRQRWGDCKDKSFLLAALLNELGLDAHPAMVNTKLRRKLDDQLPSPFMFDHVIVQVIDNGRSCWVDPTLSDQGGTLATIETPNDERALVVRADSTALTTISTRQKGSTTIEQTYTTRDWNKPTALVVRSTYTGGDADAVRADLASMSTADLARERLNRYATDAPRIAAVGKPSITDDRARNIIVISDRYTIRDLWRGGKWTYTPRSIEDHLQAPETIVRSMPLAFDYPLNLTQITKLELPEEIAIEARSGKVDDAAFHFDFDIAKEGKSVTIRHTLRALSDAIPSERIAEHLERVNAISDDLGSTIERKPRADFAAMTGLGSGLAPIGMAVLAGMVILAVVRRARS